MAHGGINMARDKAKDDLRFNCSQEHEKIYVVNLYPDDKKAVKEFLIQSCLDGTIHYSTHMEVYELIKEKLGLSIPVK